MSASAASQTGRLLRAFRKGRHITPLVGLREFGTLRLGARVWDLKQAGHPIQKRMVEVNPGVRVAEYWLPRSAA